MCRKVHEPAWDLSSEPSWHSEIVSQQNNLPQLANPISVSLGLIRGRIMILQFPILGLNFIASHGRNTLPRPFLLVGQES